VRLELCGGIVTVSRNGVPLERFSDDPTKLSQWIDQYERLETENAELKKEVEHLKRERNRAAMEERSKYLPRMEEMRRILGRVPHENESGAAFNTAAKVNLQIDCLPECPACAWERLKQFPNGNPEAPMPGK